MGISPCLSSLSCGLVFLGYGAHCPGAEGNWWWAAVSCALYQGCSFDEIRTAVMAQAGYKESLALPWK